MLVLSRRQNEDILFPGLDIVVRVLRVSGNTVRVGIDAPPDVKVLRGEIAGVQRPSLGHHNVQAQCQTPEYSI